MTSPSMKSADKKTPEKKSRTASESSDHCQDSTSGNQQPRTLDFNAFAWMRVFRFSSLLVRQG